MAYFRQDNTQGYDDAELGELNAAWEQITSHGGYALEDSDLDHDKSMLDHWSETMLSEFDAGKRGDALVAWFYICNDVFVDPESIPDIRAELAEAGLFDNES